MGGTTLAPRPSSEPLDYKIQGDNLQVARIFLKPGQEIYAEAGKMVDSVDWETRRSGNSIADKLWGSVKRKLRTIGNRHRLIFVIMDEQY